MAKLLIPCAGGKGFVMGIAIEGQDYFKAMNAAANYAFANRQILGYLPADTVRRFFNLSWLEFGYRLVYALAHNIGKVEEHNVDGKV